MNTTTAPAAPEHPEEIKWLLTAYLPTLGGNKTAAAKNLGISHKTLNALIAGTYTGDTARQLAKLREQKDRLTATPATLKNTQYIPTGILRRTVAALDAAKKYNIINIITGVPQIGKTTAAQYYKTTYPDTTILIRLQKNPTITATTRDLAEALRIRTHHTTAATRREIAERLSPRHLLIIDEAHLALENQRGADTLDAIRELYDRSGCGIALLVTDYARGRKILHSPWADMLSQLIKRGYWEILPQIPSGKDIATVWQAYGLPDPDDTTARTLTTLAKGWAFGQITRALKIALSQTTATAETTGTPVTWDAVNQIIRRLGTQPE